MMLRFTTNVDSRDVEKSEEASPSINIVWAAACGTLTSSFNSTILSLKSMYCPKAVSSGPISAL